MKLKRRLPPVVCHDLFFGNYFCLIPHSDLAFVVISNNAVAYLKRVALAAGSGSWSGVEVDVHAAVGYSDTSPYLIRVSAMDDFEQRFGPRHRFAVWRDPVARLESTYQRFCRDKQSHDYFSMLDLQGNPSIARFREFCEWEWSKTDPLGQDEHIRAQADYYQPTDVHDIVSMSAISRYLDQHGVYRGVQEPGPVASQFRIEDAQFLGRIHQVYARDYALTVNVS